MIFFLKKVLVFSKLEFFFLMNFYYIYFKKDWVGGKGGKELFFKGIVCYEMISKVFNIFKFKFLEFISVILYEKKKFFLGG